MYNSAAEKSTFITSLSFDAFLSTDTTQHCNFTYTAATTSSYIANLASLPIAGKPFYNSTCFDVSPNNGVASTASVAQFVTFDSINIYYNNTLYLSINPTTAAKYGVTPSDFFKGTVNTDFVWSSSSTFAAITTALHGTTPKRISTSISQLFIAKF